MAEICAACHDDHGGGQVVEIGDGDGVRLCRRCDCTYNVEVVRDGTPYWFRDGTPTRMRRKADLSADGVYRYSLWRQWLSPGGEPRPPVVWIGLNPSDANHLRDDPTAKRTAEFARGWGHHQQIIVNPFAYRASTPTSLPRDLAAATGPLCDQAIDDAIALVGNVGFYHGKVIACWGSPGEAWLASMLRARLPAIEAIARRRAVCLQAIGTTSDGSPKHPLARGRHRVPDEATPSPWGGA